MSVVLTDEQDSLIRKLAREIIEAWLENKPMPAPFDVHTTNEARFIVSLFAYALASTDEFEDVYG